METKYISMEKNPDHFIDKLCLKAHPEGGYFKETYCSGIVIKKDALPDCYTGDRPLLTAICFLLKGDEFSAFHRLKSDELWHFHFGSSMKIWVIRPDGKLYKIKLGIDVESNKVCQAIIPAGCWFGAAVDNVESFSLVGCTVSPGFDFADFELGKRAYLISKYPAHENIIKTLTRN